MSPRLRRVERLVELAHDALGAARARAAAAGRALAEARTGAERDERSWSDAAQGFGVGVTRAADLDQQGAHLRTLRARADASARRVEKAAADERQCAAGAVQAAMEHRKLELWRDRIAAGERQEETRLERASADELAARITRVRA
jgi:hypothetical protein